MRWKKPSVIAKRNASKENAVLLAEKESNNMRAQRL